MGATIQRRFVAFELAAGWIDLASRGTWRLGHAERKGTLLLSQYPAVQGTMTDLRALRDLSRERFLAGGDRLLGPCMLLDETAWSEGGVFGVASSERIRSSARNAHQMRGLVGRSTTYYVRRWTVSNGVYLLDAALHTEHEAEFEASVEECDRMMRSVRFSGPS